MERMTEGARSHPFNSALETGIRALVVLEAFHPCHCDLTELRTGELLVRRRLVEESLLLMQRVHLVDVVDGENGISFAASEDAPSFLDLLKAPYTVELKKRAAWVAERFSGMSKSKIGELVDEKRTLLAIEQKIVEARPKEAVANRRDWLIPFDYLNRDLDKRPEKAV